MSQSDLEEPVIFIIKVVINFFTGDDSHNPRVSSCCV